MSPQETLAQLGLDEKEISVYMGLLELGEATILTISKKTGVKRPTAYLILEALERRGLATKVAKGKKTLFVAQHPKKILTEAEVRLKQLKEVMPQFEAMMQRSDDRPRVKIYEGKDALDRAYDDAFIVKGEMLFMSNIEVTEDVYAKTLQKFDYIAYSKDFCIRELIIENEASKKYAAKNNGQYRRINFLPQEFGLFTTDIGIYGNNVVITSGKKEYFCVRIESPEIADAFRAMFEAVWRLSRGLNG